ncbi:hypothetical protein CI238_13599, partial [Colletotrichum incanum]
MSLRTTVL